mgnify:CR=1 FL=1
MDKFIVNECGHVVTAKTFPVTLCHGKHMCGALFDPYGMSKDCQPAKGKVKVCSKCAAIRAKLRKAEKDEPLSILKAAAKLLGCEPDRSILNAILLLKDCMSAAKMIASVRFEDSNAKEKHE